MRLVFSWHQSSAVWVNVFGFWNSLALKTSFSGHGHGQASTRAIQLAWFSSFEEVAGAWSVSRAKSSWKNACTFFLWNIVLCTYSDAFTGDGESKSWPFLHLIPERGGHSKANSNAMSGVGRGGFLRSARRIPLSTRRVHGTWWHGLGRIGLMAWLAKNQDISGHSILNK